MLDSCVCKSTKNNSKLTLVFKEDKVLAHITYGIKTKVYEINHGETDLYLGQVGGIDYYFNLNNGENEVYTHYPITGKVQLISTFEQNMVLREIICNR